MSFYFLFFVLLRGLLIFFVEGGSQYVFYVCLFLIIFLMGFISMFLCFVFCFIDGISHFCLLRALLNICYMFFLFVEGIYFSICYFLFFGFIDGISQFWCLSRRFLNMRFLFLKLFVEGIPQYVVSCFFVVCFWFACLIEGIYIFCLLRG